jgi:cysteinyl-tRNA synthetase
MLQIYNSLSKQKETFNPIDKNNVRLYVCGMTVYDFCHLGHARVLIVFDVVYRYLKKIYGENQVTYIRNITDIDDKIINRANENKEDIGDLTARFIEEMNKDAAALGVQKPNEEPRATSHMQQIIDMIQSLIDKGYAYQGANRDIYYEVNKFDGYGKLSGRNLEDEQAGARVEVDASKRDPMDFVLWKSAKPGEPSWDSPWGPGRPGWHIECSAMSTHCLGNHFDIHGGGMDLKFPHHENEIAQSEAATGETFANLWMHNGHIMVDEEKMSKSLGNFFTVREVLKQYKPEVVRYFILSSHYRSPLNYSQENLDTARAALERLYTALRGVQAKPMADLENNEFVQRFDKAMDDDFNTVEAISALFDLTRELNKQKAENPQAAAELAGLMKHFGATLGLLQDDPEVYLKGGAPDGEGLSDDEIESLITQRTQARKDKNWAESDRIRDELKAQGIVLEDGAGGTSWRRE